MGDQARSTGGSIDEDGFIERLTAEWKVMHERYGGEQAQLTMYRASMGLPPLQGDCPPGEYWSFSSRCEPCPAGHSCPDSSKVACPKGQHAPTEGYAECIPCPVNTWSPSPATITCADCPLGTYRDDDMADCLACPENTYYNDEQLACVSCNAGRENEVPHPNFVSPAGSLEISACTCARGTFWNRAADRCDECPAKAYCHGGLTLPFATAHTYGVYEGSVTPSLLDTQNTAKLAGTYAADPSAFKNIKVYTCFPAGVTCPGGTIAGIDGITDLRKGYSSDDETGVCPANRVPSAIACGTCEPGYYGGPAKACTKCGGLDYAGSIIALFVFVPIVVVGMYQVTSSPMSMRLTASTVLVSTFGVGTFFLQTMGVYRACNLDWPIELTFVFDLSAIILFDLQGLSLGCVYGDSFAAKYWVSIAVPLFLLFITGLCFGVMNNVIRKPSMIMKLDQTMSMIGMVFSALYISLVKVVIAYFEQSRTRVQTQT